MKVFISQPMTGRPKEEILNERNEVIKILESKYGVEVLDSYFEDYDPQNGSIPLKYLAKSIEVLAEADVLLCVGDWENSKGCKVEHECANQYGIKIFYWGE